MPDIEFNNKGLLDLIKSLEKVPVLRLGVLGGKNHRSGKGTSNATIGAKHEYGADGMPQRSFLRVPITEQLQAYLDRSQAFTKEALMEVVADKSLGPWMKKVGVIAETIVQDAFASGGFGKWKPHSPGYENNTGQILVDTTQLRDSITSEVK